MLAVIIIIIFGYLFLLKEERLGNQVGFPPHRVSRSVPLSALPLRGKSAWAGGDLQCQDEDDLIWEHQPEVLAHPEDLNAVLGRGVDCVIPGADFL